MTLLLLNSNLTFAGLCNKRLHNNNNNNNLIFNLPPLLITFDLSSKFRTTYSFFFSFSPS